MDISKKARPKKNSRFRKSQDYPLFKNENNEILTFTGKFNGICVVVENIQEMEKIYYNGYFGKANLSRGFPCFNKSIENTPVIRQRQFENRRAWKQKFDQKSQQLKTIVVPDSDSDSEVDDYFTNLKAAYQIDPYNVKESLHLNLEEAMFLSDTLKCLNVIHEENSFKQENLWKLFCETDPYFEQNYIAYHYFRAKNWVVKSGIKFGGDFLLYKDGPPFFHASFLVIIDVIEETTNKRRADLCRRSMNTVDIIGLNRLCETAGKELLIFQIFLPNDFKTNIPEDIKNVTVKTILVNRFILSQEREAKEESEHN